MRVASITGSSIRYFHKDHLGSTSAVTDGSGNIMETADYKPFGGLRDYSGTVTTQYKFTDQEFDPESGLYNYNARFYDPALGRFISPDSIVQGPFSPQTLNRYSYVGNNPLMYVDPSGHFLSLPVIIGAVIGGVSSGIQSDWDFGKTLTGAIIGGVSGYVGYEAGSWAFDAVGGGTAGLFAGGGVGGATAGGTGGGLYSVAYGGNVAGGIWEGARYGALGGLVISGLLQVGVPNLFASMGGGYASGYAQGGAEYGQQGLWYAFGGSVMSATLRTRYGLGMDGEVPRRGTEDRAYMEMERKTYALTAQKGSTFWQIMNILLGGYEHTWHTQDRQHRLYDNELNATTRYYRLIDRFVLYPREGEAYLENFRMLSNNCTTRFGYLHPGQYLAHHAYVEQGGYWWSR